jgi:hypothetical protein
MQNGRDKAVRVQIEKLLAGGLKTQTEPFPEDNHQFADLLAALRDLDPADLKAKLVLSGFTNYPYGPDRMRCQECMYYLVMHVLTAEPQVVRSSGTGGAG